MWLNIEKGAAMTRTEIEKALYKFSPAITMNLTEIAKARKKAEIGQVLLCQIMSLQKQKEEQRNITKKI